VSIFERLRALPAVAVLLVGVAVDCGPAGDCLRFSDCAAGLTCADGKCVAPPPPAPGDGGSEAAATAPPVTGGDSGAETPDAGNVSLVFEAGDDAPAE
jgi:hypothetical protein